MDKAQKILLINMGYAAYCATCDELIQEYRVFWQNDIPCCPICGNPALMLKD